jgi:pSer/pThr/pTyr-binding forkhead associated (FHA) protein
MFKLVIQDDEGKTTVVPLIRDEITIGRKEGNTIRLTERNVSRRHARILRNNGEVQIEDLGSYNGIRVNNARIAERVSLRVSDQVQIGDYKLYLKAEGVEQVDDARTMPIERIDAPATEVMPAIAPPPATAPMAAQAIPATPAPNRTPAATADTDPSGRPVATAAQVAALTQATGYGKLVVISSNFAGKEFELARPQMIIGRTHENDIEINHRSISRNHAKVTRDPETGRYTISDLHSSNGVRVNGQDYTKVELRKADVVDLGHVRMRFVEPGEDWLFSRDAVIADVPDAGGGSKKGLWIALFVLILGGGVAAFFVLGKKDTGGGSGQNGSGGPVVVGNQAGSGGTDNGGSDNGSGVAMVATPDAAVVPDDDAGRIKMECLQDAADKKWTDVTSCADRLMPLKPDDAKKLKTQAASELKNELTVKKLDDAIGSQDLVVARKLLKEIPDDSTYHADAEKKVDDLQDKIVTELKGRAEGFKRAKRCSDIDKMISQTKSSYGASVADEITPYKCETVAVAPDHGNDHGGDHGGGHTGSATVTPPPPASCDPKELEEKGVAAEGAGQHALALGSYESALKCKGANTPRLNKLAFMAACELKSVDRARKYWSKLAANEQATLLQMCLRSGITKDELDK